MNHPHRFLLFAGSDYYAKGGMNDLHCSSADLESARLLGEELIGDASKDAFDWYHVWDTLKGKVVAKSKHQAYGADDDMKGLVE